MKRVAAFALLTVIASPSFGAERSITIVNGTGLPLKELAVRSPGSSEWKPVAPGLSPGARTSVSVEEDGGCAFDVRGTVSGGNQVIWTALNLCETKSVSLNRRADGLAWADYD